MVQKSTFLGGVACSSSAFPVHLSDDQASHQTSFDLGVSAVLNFDEERFRSIQHGAVALAEPLRVTVADVMARGARNVFFLGAGGAGVLMLPAAQLLQRTTTFPTQLVHAAEIVVTDSAALGEGSVVVVPSLSGTT